MTKTPYLIGGLAAVILTGAAGSALAQVQDAQPQRQARNVEVSRADFIDRRIERLTRADADADGTVTAEEMRAARQAGRSERAAARFARLDVNNDGVLTEAEFNARPERGARQVRMGHRMERRGGRHAAKIERGPVVIAEARTPAEQAFDRLDADRNGVVSREERRAHMAQRRAERRASPQAPASE